jgi:hypothetical protein
MPTTTKDRQTTAVPAIPPPDHILAADLGQAQDYSALVAMTRSWQRSQDDPSQVVSHFELGYLKRWQLGTRYTRIVDDVGELVEKKPLDHPVLGIDGTGVGRAVVEMFTTAGMRAVIRPVLITAGHEVTLGDEGWHHVPKKELVSALQVLLQARRLQIADLPEREVLVRELAGFKVKITVAANETFESWRERDHDDLVLASAIAAWLGAHTALPWTAPPVVETPRRRLEPGRPPEEQSARKKGGPTWTSFEGGYPNVILDEPDPPADRRPFFGGDGPDRPRRRPFG